MAGCGAGVITQLRSQSTPRPPHRRSKVHPHLGCHFGRRFARLCNDPCNRCNLWNSEVRLDSAPLPGPAQPGVPAACPDPPGAAAPLTCSAAEPRLWSLARSLLPGPAVPLLHASERGWLLVPPRRGGVSPGPAPLRSPLRSAPFVLSPGPLPAAATPPTHDEQVRERRCFGSRWLRRRKVGRDALVLLVGEGTGVALGRAPASPDGLVCGQVSSFSGKIRVLKESHRCHTPPTNSL